MKKRLIKDLGLHKINTLIVFIIAAINIFNLITVIINYSKNSLIATIGTFIFLIVAIVFFKNNVFITTLTISLFLALLTAYGDLTSFFFALMAIGIYKRYKYIVLGIYFVAFCISFTFNDFVFSSCIAHVLGCVFCYFLHNSIFKKYDNVILNLTEQEKLILHELSQGKTQKEVSCFSGNTVSKYIQNAKERNNIATTSELLQKYVHSN